MQEPGIKTIAEKKLIGKSLRMSISHDRTFELFRSFMPERKKIENITGTDVFCLQIYDDALDFNQFKPDTGFEKWAAVEVSEFGQFPEGMKAYTLKEGLYAVFIYKGLPGEFGEMFRYIFYSWLPASPYVLDKRAHFQIMGDKYKNNDPDSEEEVWVPIKPKE